MKISDREKAARRLNDDSLREAVQTLLECGYVVLEDLLPIDWIDRTREACDAEIPRYLERLPADKRQRMIDVHCAMFPPPCEPFLDPQAIENDFAVQVTEAAMGPGFFCTFYNTNTQLPHSGGQAVHRDFNHLFPGHPVALPIIQTIVNIPLTDFTLENGATECWPGTHLIVDERHEDGKRLDERAARLASERTTVRKGDLILRDMRAWHRGMPNRTDEIRTMLALIYNRPFLNPYISATALYEIPRTSWEKMSERAREIFRFCPVVDRDPPYEGIEPPYG